MSDLALEVGWQVDDADCAKWALLGADTTSYTQTFRQKGNLRLRRDLNTQATASNHRTCLFALLSTFLR